MAKSQQKPQNVQKTSEQKMAETRQKAAEGQTKPIPTAADTPPEEKKEVEDRVKVLAAKIAAEEEKRKAELEAKRAEIKKLQDELKAAREAEKSEARKAKEAKEEVKKLALAERAKKEAEIAAADEAIVKAQKDLEATEEWSLLQMAKEARAAIGPLPKIPKLGGTSKGDGTPRKPRTNGGPTLRLRIFQLLAERARTGAEVRDACDLTTVPMILKDEGVCENPRIERYMEEGQRGVLYSLTALGREHLENGLVDAHPAPNSSGISWPD